MARGLPRTSFHSPTLVRALAGLAVTEATESKQALGERLGQWLDFKDAIALFSALNDTRGAGDAATAARAAPAAGGLHEEIGRVRTALTEAIRNPGNPGRASIRLPAPDPHAAPGTEDFVPYHRYYLAHQRDMSASIAPLRAHARAVLAKHSPALARLAALDGVLDQALAPRERSLLATVPQLLARRFAQLQQAQTDAPDGHDAADGWLATFCGDMQAVLLAELELRLQPVLGLAEALGNKKTDEP